MPLSAAAKAQSPDARPTVQVRLVAPANPYLPWMAECSTGDCDYTYGPALKTDAQQHATWHRQDHRRRAARSCSVCGCTDTNACTYGGGSCHWVNGPLQDPLCNVCQIKAGAQ